MTCIHKVGRLDYFTLPKTSTLRAAVADFFCKWQLGKGLVSVFVYVAKDSVLRAAIAYFFCKWQLGLSPSFPKQPKEADACKNGSRGFFSISKNSSKVLEKFFTNSEQILKNSRKIL